MEPIKIGTRRDYQIGKRYTTSLNPRYNTLVWIAVALAILCAFLGGAYIGEDIASTRPADPSDPGFVNVEGHEGEVLVVGPNLQLRWTTEAELHEAAGHG